MIPQVPGVEESQWQWKEGTWPHLWWEWGVLVSDAYCWCLALLTAWVRKWFRVKTEHGYTYMCVWQLDRAPENPQSRLSHAVGHPANPVDFNSVHEIYCLKYVVRSENTPWKSIQWVVMTTDFSLKQTIQCWQRIAKRCWSCSGTDSKVMCSHSKKTDWKLVKCLLNVHFLSLYLSCKCMRTLCVQESQWC